LNLYEFSQVNNNEMGILITKDQDESVFKDAYEEAQRIIRISDEVRISLDEVKEAEIVQENNEQEDLSKLTTSKLAAKHKIKTNELLEQFVHKGFLILNDKGKHQLTEQGKTIGGEFKFNSYGGYFLWLADMNI
jgi:esterase/lipase